MINLKYRLYLKKWRASVKLIPYANIIESGILKYVPDAYGIRITNNYYSFKCSKNPTRGQLIAIGRYISYHSNLGSYVKQYNSKCKKWKPARKLFVRVK